MAIPKIIHYCWFGPNKMPKTALMCLKSWKEKCPDYEVVLWNELNSPMDNNFIQSAMLVKKYAFVADYVRTWALFNYGGIYVDTDMLLIKGLDNLLKNDMVLAYEQEGKKNIGVGIWGSVPNHEFLSQVLSFYNNNVLDINNIFYFTIPNILTREYKKYKGGNDIRVYDYDWFYAFPGEMKHYNNYMDYVTQNSVGVHLWDMSWLTLKERIINFVKKIFLIEQKYIFDE